MATTIVTKYGSDAPAASDLVRGELAVDTENGRLYTENSSGAVVEIGLNPEGSVTANAGISVDNINIDGTTIALSSGDLTLDSAGDITFDADGGDWRFKDAGTTIATYSNVGGSWYITSNSADGDIVFQGNDGGSTITALTLNMSEAGEASFGSDVLLGDSKVLRFGADQDLRISFDGSNGIIQNVTGDSDIIFKGKDGTSIIEAMRIDMSANGSVGIGTGANVDTKLHVEEATANTACVATIEAASWDAGLVLKNGNGTWEIHNDYSDTAALNFFGHGASRMTISSAGSVGIGNSTVASTRFAVTGSVVGANIETTSATAGHEALIVNRQNSDGTAIAINKAGTTVGSIGTLSSKIYVGSDDTALFFDSLRDTLVPHNASTNASRGSAISLGRDIVPFNNLYLSGGVYANNASGAFLWNAENAHIAFGTNNTERMRIDSSGNLLVAKTSANAALAGGEIRATGNIFSSVASSNNIDITLGAYSTSAGQWQMYVGMAGTIYARSTSISSLSDARRKENIVDLETGLTEVMALRPRRFDWKNSQEGDDRQIAGFIAQEVEAVLPDLISSYKDEEVDDLKSLRMGDMLPTLVKAIQEQQATIEALTARIAALES